MAIPIRPTPVLKGREATAFERRLSGQHAMPLKVTCAPSLEAAREAVFGSRKQHRTLASFKTEPEPTQGTTMEITYDAENDQIVVTSDDAKYVMMDKAENVRIDLKSITRLISIHNHSDMVDMDAELVQAEKLIAWARERKKEILPLVDAYQRGPNSIRDAKTARRLLGILEEHGHVVRVAGTVTVDGKPRREVWRVIQFDEPRTPYAEPRRFQI